MSKINIKDLIKTGLNIGSIFTGGKVKSVLDIVNQGINDKSDTDNIQPLKDLATVNDEQNDVLINHEKRLRVIEAKLGIKT